MLSVDHQPDVLVVKCLACNTKNLLLQISKSYDVKVANVKVAGHFCILFHTVLRSCPIRQFLERSKVFIFFDFNRFSGFTNRTACNRLYSKSADRSDFEP